ncbi:amino acid permease [Kitasatospora atroaurantiaca]|uniref:Amino acid/polyamine/organocation transporter (APC superfamily) n=1 Tax=Kitasatospora atroaurantiaca TaxID=285545 RepID=A0A561EU71_9ACTN|nr:amino acid permease [Kitasatospora atroaurantiaca]TWE19159.1 amino acid/polyamine/organocation transporter (APC superfamily) [Kitasatospora atroaurantiaca]
MTSHSSLGERLFRRKPVASLIAESGAADALPAGAPEEGGRSGIHLRRSIGLWQLSSIGIGATVGTGIFFVLSSAVPEAGPAVILSFLIAAVTAGLTALCYAEMASAIPVSGSSYSYAYATLGEVVAFGVGVCLLLEYGVSASAIAVSWGQYLNKFFDLAFGFQIPDWMAAPPGDGGYFNLPAVILVAMVVFLLIRGVGESAKVNATMVGIKIVILVLFIAIGLTGFHSGNLRDFMPLGFGGVQVAASSIFFSFIGLDAVSTAGEEVKNPRRTLPLAIIISLVVVTLLYVGVALAAIGAQHWQLFDGQEAGLAQILQDITGQTWPAMLFAIGAIISIFSVTLVVIYGQTRILYSMGRDGMLPKKFAEVSPRTGTPVWNTVVVGIAVAVLAAFVPLDILTDLTSLGTLVAFSVVSVGVIILRRTQPDLPRGFKVPGYPVVPLLSVGFCAYLIYGLHPLTYLFFGIALALAAAVYFGYSIKHSRLNQPEPELAKVA